MTIKELIDLTPCAYDFSEECAIQVEAWGTGAHFRKDDDGTILIGGCHTDMTEADFYEKSVAYLEWEADVLTVTVK